MNKRKIILVAHNVRSANNVGSLLRTADGLGVEMVYLTGYTPYPIHDGDRRLPHEAIKVSKQIQKTALGAQNSVNWKYVEDVFWLLTMLESSGSKIIALEQTPGAIDLSSFKAGSEIVLVVGSEIGGIEKSVLELADTRLQIPMLGDKESFNVAVAAAMALYHFRFVA